MGAEIGHTIAQHRRVERHINARDHDEGTLAGGHLLRSLTQRLQPGACTGHRVLKSGEVVVHNLQEFARFLGNIRHEVKHIVRGQPHLVGAQGSQAVVGVAFGVAIHQAVHGQPTAVHDLHHGFQGQHTGVGGQRVVFAHGMPSEEGALVQGTRFPHFRDLRHTQGGHGHLRELREEQHALRVVELLPLDHYLGGVVLHDLQHGESQLGAGVSIRPVPHFLGGLGVLAGFHAHPLGLDTLAGECVERHGCRHHCGGLEHQVSVDGGGDFPHLAAPGAIIDARALNQEVDACARHDRGQHGGRIFHDAVRRGRGGVVAVPGGGDEFRECGGPHAVHNHAWKASKVRGRLGDVDGVAVSGNQREGQHAFRCGDRGESAERPWGVNHARQRRGIGAGGAGAPAATNGKTLRQGGQARAVRINFGANQDEATNVGVLHLVGVRRDGQLCGALGEGVREFDVMLHMHQAQHALHHGIPVGAGNHGIPHSRENGGPGVPNQHVRGGAACSQAGRQECGGDVVVVGGLGGVDTRGPGGRAVLHLGERATGGDAGEFRHRGLRIGLGDLRDSAISVSEGETNSQVSGGAKSRGTRQRHGQHGVVLVLGDKLRARRSVGRFRSILSERPRMCIAQTLDHGGSVAASPVGARSVNHALHRSGGHVFRRNAQLFEALDRRGIETTQQLSHRLVHLRDARNSGGAGNDADGIGVIAGVLRLPQGIRTPPAAHVLIDHRHEIHRLTQGASQLQEPRHIRRVQHIRGGLRVLLHEASHGLLGGLILGERNQRGELPMVLVRQAGFRALQHLSKTVKPGNVGPTLVGGLSAGGLSAGGRPGQLQVTLQPLLIGHGLHIAEIRLAGLSNRRNDLLAAGLHGLLITRDLIQQTASLSSGIINLMNIRAQLRTARRHAVDSGTGTHPGIHALGVRQKLLDLRRRLRLLGGHRCGAHQNAVDRHLRQIVGQCPLTADVIRGALRGANAAAHHQHRVRLLTNLVIRGNQQVIQILPRMVATRLTTLNLDDHRNIRHLTRH